MLGVEIEVILIKTVQKHPVLYDRSDPSFNDLKARNDVWKSITACVNRSLPPDKQLTTQRCKEYWFNMRNRFRNSVKRRSDNPKLVNLKWIHHDNMAFLFPYLMHSRANAEDTDNTQEDAERNASDSNSDDASEKSDHFLTEYLVDKLDERTEAMSEAEKVTLKKIPEVNDDANVSIVTWNDSATSLTRFDDMDLFFLGMAKDIKVLPVEVRAQLRIDIAKALRDAEVSANMDSGPSSSC